MDNVTTWSVLMKRMIFMGLLAIAAFAIFPKGSRATIYVGIRTKASVFFEDVDHSGWNRLLQKYVNDDGQVAYQAWHTSPDDRRALEEYLTQLSHAGPGTSTTTSARLAFWINAYNALTVHGILREYPTTSIRNHTSKLGGYNIWKHLQLYVDGTPHSLNHIEHEILRKLNEPRIHFAIVCASVGCPRLLNEAYLDERLNEQLESNARDFFGRSRNFQYDSGLLKLSAILKWFATDFGPTQQDQLNTIARWLPDQDAQQTATSGQARIDYLDYDWDLNTQN
jgi:hypothetical protein